MKLEMGEDILFYAFRYALGRRTHAVSTVCTELIRQRGFLQDRTRKLISEEIRKAKQEGNLGDACDINQWWNVYSALNCDEEAI